MREASLAVSVVVGASAYAVLRYVVFGTVPAEQIPVFVVNKGVAVAALAMMGAALLAGPRAPERDARRVARVRRLGRAAAALALLHTVLSLAALTPAGYGKLYEPSGALTVWAALAVLAGALGFVLVAVLVVPPAAVSEEGAGSRSTWPVARLALALVAAHVLALGWRGWFTPADWPGGMPPITLLSFLLAVVFLAVRQLRRVSP